MEAGMENSQPNREKLDSLRKQEDKIKTVEQMMQLSETFRQQAKTVVLCHGEFDLVHPGHIKYFQASKREGDILMVTLTPDKFVTKGPGRPVFNQFIRAETIASLECVDFVAINQWPTAVETLKAIKPNVYSKGSEYLKREADVTGRIAIEEKVINELGGRMHFTEEITFSASTLINRHFNVYPDKTNQFLNHFREKFTSDDIIERIKSLANMKVLVIGEVILDEYYYCEAMGKSPKNPIITTKYRWHEQFAGGVLATANHIAGFCNKVDLITSLGKKNGVEKFIRQHLKPNIKATFFENPNVHTVIKRRFVDAAFLNKLFEICYIDQEPMDEKIEEEMISYIKEVIKQYDLVLVSDFGHDLISPRIVETLCRHSKFLAVNTQTNSANHGFNMITKYPKADYVCIDEPEIRLAKHDKYGDLKDIMDEITYELRCKYLTVTRGHRGAAVHQNGNGYKFIPVFSTKVVDTIGAGDAFLSVTAPCAAAGFEPELIGFIGNAVGALAVQIVGNKESVEPMPLFKFITTLLK